MTEEQTVYIVDDDPAARKSLSALASSMGLRNEVFASAEEFLKAYPEDQAGCLITDIRMLGMSGIELQERLKELDIAVPVIVITAFADTKLTVRAMKNGAITLLEKPCRDQELWEAIRAALQVDAQLRDSAIQRREIRRRMETLSDQERHVLQGVVDGKPNKLIAKELDVSIRTVEARRHAVFEKMETTSVADLVKQVMILQTDDE